MARLPLLAGAPLLCLSLLLQEASGGGYAIPHQSARAVGLANAVTAGVADPSAVYVNPAGLTEIEGNRVLAGVNYIHVVSSIGNSGRTSVNRHDDNFIPTLFANYHLPATDLTAGIGLYAPFGLAATYDENSFTRFGAIRSELRTMYATPAIAWRINPSLSVGGGVSFVHSSALFSRALALGGGAEGKIRITDTDNGYGYNVGLLYKPVERIKLGLTYRSRVDLNFDTALAKVADATGATSTARSKGTQIPLPPVISVGLNWQINPYWNAEFVHDHTHWSEFRHIKARFTPALLGGGLRGLFIQSLWKDTSILRLGTSYRATENLELRAGITVDESPIPARTLSPTIPGADLLTLNAGLGYRWGSLGVDLAYMAVFYKRRSVLNDVLEAGNAANTVAPGRDKYEIFHNFVSLHFSYRF